MSGGGQSGVVPTPGGDRDEGLDAARGLAILGLIFCNIPSFASMDHYRSMVTQADRPGGWEAVQAFGVELLLTGKCVTLLCFLFGAGLALQAARNPEMFGLQSLRRLAALFLIGALHILLLWWGDILCAYALTGAAVVLLHRFPSRTHRWVAGIAFGGSFLILTSLLLVAAGPADKEADALTMEILKAVEAAYQSGGYFSLLPVRLLEALFIQLFTLLMLPISLAVALLGFDAVRTGWFPWRNRPWPMAWVAGLAIFGVATNAAAAISSIVSPDSDFVYVLAALPGALALALLYLWASLRLPAGRLRTALALVGRTALSNYLLQSFCAAVVFYPWGLGLFGKLNSGTVFVLALLIVLLQLTWPGWWLARFRFGPAEWLWRWMTYGRAVTNPH